VGYAFAPCNCLPFKADLALKSNILVDNNGHACLAGFNLLTMVPDELTIASLGSPSKGASRSVAGAQWSAPEVLEGGALGKKTDIFSFAMIMIEARHR
jgi:serine/threonine protein kinase